MNKPTLLRAQALSLLGTLFLGEKAILIGVRGFTEPVGSNKKGIYDDAIFLLTDESIEGWNANTDPSIDRAGMAVLQPGKYTYVKGIHGVHHLNTKLIDDKVIYNKLMATGKDVPDVPLTYWALRQAGPVTLLRDGKDSTEEDGWPNNPAWIDIHRGGVNSTSSEGCQTVVSDEWLEMRDKVFAAMDKYGLHDIFYVLVEKTEDTEV